VPAPEAGVMILTAVMDEVAACLDQVPGLQVYAWPPGKISTVPSAVVSYPKDLKYQVTYGRGVNSFVLPVVLALGKPNDRQTREVASKFLSGGGAGAVAALVDAWDWQSCSEVTATEGDTDVVSVGGTEYLAALFMLEVVGQGAG
jgi:hypothetical protein